MQIPEFPHLLQPYSYKVLEYRYWGRSYHLHSSQELFSATQIDRGSQLLLASLLPEQGAAAPKVPKHGEALGQNSQSEARGQSIEQLLAKAWQAAEPRLEIWDWGCGIGTLGIMAQGHVAQLQQKHHKLQREEGREGQELHCELRVFDRNALALAFTQANWQQNIAAQPSFSPSLHVASGIWGEEPLGLGPESSEVPVIQLVLSNIPAKLGEPVLRKVLPALAASPSSYVAIVIVAPLRHLLEEAAASGQIEILYSLGSGDHCVIHYRQRQGGDQSEERMREPAAVSAQMGCQTQLPNALKLYKRGESCFALERRGSSFILRKSSRPSGKDTALLHKNIEQQAKWLVRWPFRSAYGLSDFDHPSYSLELFVRLLTQRNWGGRVLLWEPGHGHLACFLALKPGMQLRQIDLAGRNRLSLIFAEYNLKNLANFSSRPLPAVHCHSLPCLEALDPPPPQAASAEEEDGRGAKKKHSGWDLIVLPVEDKLSKSQATALRSWLGRLEPGTRLCLQGRSHAVQRLQLEHLNSWTPPQPSTKDELRGHGLLTQLWHN